MKEIPILFSTAMVQAILQGRKTQTRRIVKTKFFPASEIASIHKDGSGKGWIAWSPLPVSAEKTKELYPGEDGFKCHYGTDGDVLWVRENFRVSSWVPDDSELTFRYEADGVVSPYLVVDTYESQGEIFNRYWKQSCDDLYKAGYNSDEDESFKDYDYKALRLRPNIFLPKEAARIWLQVTDVRVERLQDITEEDAIAEGVKPAGCDDNLACPSKLCINECVDKDHWWNYLAPNGEDFPCFTAVESFKSLWQSINSPESWEADPWVFVISFKVLSTTGKPDLQTLKSIA